ncbi:putative rNA-binding protein, partial [Orientia tsutsugamushi str. Karp]
HHATKSIEKFNTQDLANSIWALGRLGIQPQDTFIQAWIHYATNCFSIRDVRGDIL